MVPEGEFTEEQRRYLEGLARGLEVGRLRHQNGGSSATAPSGPDAAQLAAQDRAVAGGRKLSAEERAKRDRHPLDLWDEMAAAAEAGRFPEGADVFRYKFHGLFYVAPAEHAYMCRLRLPNGVVRRDQMRGLADLAERWADGWLQLTTRANLQLRGIAARDAIDVLTGLCDMGIVNRGAGADNVRNVTGSPAAGIDPQELIDTRPLAHALHHRILGRRDLFGLPRKFNVAFDGGGVIGTVADTNDVGFVAVRVREGQAVPPGPAFRLLLGGVTGHGRFADDAGVVVPAARAVDVALAIVEVFLEHGDRTDRRRARLRHLLDDWGLPRFLARVRERLGFDLPAVPPSGCEPRGPVDRLAHVGVHPQRQPGRSWIGVVVSVGRMTAAQLRGLADVAGDVGSADCRLTVWQNLLLPDVPDARVPEVTRRLEALGLHWSPSHVRAGLVACTGNTGCKFAASDTKRHAEAIAARLERRFELDQPLNVHLTGCPNSCAQHYVGDVGLLGTKVATGDEAEVEGYHVYLGGGADGDASLARELARDVPADDVPALVERLVAVWLAHRAGPGETFLAFTRRHDPERLRAWLAEEPA